MVDLRSSLLLLSHEVVSILNKRKGVAQECVSKVFVR